MKRKQVYKDVIDLVITLKDNIMLSSSDLTILFNNLLFNTVENLGNLPYSTLESILLELFVNIKRYNSAFKLDNFGVFIILQTEPFTAQDKYFIKFISLLGADIIIFNPLKVQNDIGISTLYDINFEDTLNIEKFPQNIQEASYSTVAYNAESEITEMLYGDDSGLYKDMQFDKMQSVILKTTFEEIDLLWDEPLNMRTGFSTNNGVVIIPTIYAKVNGIKLNNKYFSDLINKLGSHENTLFIRYNNYNLFDNNSRGAFLNNDYLRARNTFDFDKIKQESNYKYDYLRLDIQNNILNAVQTMVTEKIVLVDNINYILDLAMSLNQNILNMLQVFDYTKVNPKVVYINNSRELLSQDYTILFSILNILGFDILMFVPTGYNVIEKYFNKVLYETYNVGDYVYDFQLKEKSVFQKLFGK